ncbi:MAG: hypothetical protein OXQ29_08365 [Rhodospirillaceae bacterium]|nr:hypothetical protein [Rhodospirillaceae bacterium]
MPRRRTLSEYERAIERNSRERAALREGKRKEEKRIESERRKQAQKQLDLSDRLTGRAIRLELDEFESSDPQAAARLRTLVQEILERRITKPDERGRLGLPPPADAASNGPDGDGAGPQQRTPGIAGIRIDGGKAIVRTPQRSAEFSKGMRKLGGNWSTARQEWSVHARHAGEVTNLARTCYENVETGHEG